MLKNPTQRKYCALGVYLFGYDDPALLRVKEAEGGPGRVILFDTKKIAQQMMPLLGMGRMATWSKDGEYISFSPISETGFNRACVITDYDPYRLPQGMPKDLKSEVLGFEWKRHIMWSLAFFDVGGNMVKREGKTLNRALGEA